MRSTAYAASMPHCEYALESRAYDAYPPLGDVQGHANCEVSYRGWVMSASTLELKKTSVVRIVPASPLRKKSDHHG